MKKKILDADRGEIARRIIRAPFAGNVCEIPVTEGQEVSPGDRVIVLEAMKMQTPVTSVLGGVVLEIFVGLGQAVQPGDKLMEIATDGY